MSIKNVLLICASLIAAAYIHAKMTEPQERYTLHVPPGNGLAYVMDTHTGMIQIFPAIQYGNDGFIPHTNITTTQRIMIAEHYPEPGMSLSSLKAREELDRELERVKEMQRKPGESEADYQKRLNTIFKEKMPEK